MESVLVNEMEDLMRLIDHDHRKSRAWYWLFI